MSFAPGAPVPWTIPPDWSSAVRETLGWYTTLLQARSGPTQKRQMRLSPRRAFNFSLITGGQERRLVDALLFDRGARVYELPIWHDLQVLVGDVDLGSSTIPCATAGFEFVAGGRANVWRSANQFELVDIAEVAPDGLMLAAPLTASWLRGTRLYPVRAARTLEVSEDRAMNDEVGARTITFAIDEPCDWPVVAPVALYRGLPVLEWRTDESDEPKSSYARILESVDDETSLVSYFDFPGVSFRSTDVQFLMGDRAGHAAFRSLLYWLEGSTQTLWVPSWTSDLQLAAAVTGTRTTLQVDWAGYTVFGRAQPNRRDLRIELNNGTVHYRRIIGAVEEGSSELLTIDSALPADLPIGQVRQISYLTASEMASDNVELSHITDASGLTRSTLAFRAVKDADL